MSSTPEFNDMQLKAARAKAWHQDGDALLTLDAAREWIGHLGLVLFAPRPQITAPAPSLVEATLGAANEAPTAAESEVARSLVARMVADGVALPLNLLGVPGDMPDFIVSAQVFSYVFTLRGDKAWKVPPATSGAIKVSPLGLKIYEALTEKGALTAVELANELGREVTEAAILRALVELWAQLRVLPLLQAGNAPTMWELATRRFTKAIKAGANAGAPTALSALVSLYLAQAQGATEDEIETFLSTLTARSRVREVLHALMGARQLETAVLEGKTLLHVPGSLSAFPATPVDETAAVDGEEPVAAVERPKKVGTGRIAKFDGGAKSASEFHGKPVRSSAGRAGGARPTARFGARADGKTDAERRPFKKAGAPAKPSFTKPWEEGKKERPARSAAAAPDSFTKFRKPAPADREPLGDREQQGLPPAKRVFSKPRFERESTSRDEAKRPYKPRTAEGGDKPAFKPRSFERPSPGGFGAKRPYTPRSAEGGDRPYAKKPYAPRSAEGGPRSFSKPAFSDKKPSTFGAKRPYTPRTAEGGERPAFPKRPYTPRTSEGGERSFSKPSFGDKRPGNFGAKRPYTPREDGDRPKRPYTPRTSEGGDRPAFEKRPYTPRTEGGFSKPRFGAGAKPGGFAKREFTPRIDADAERSMPKRPYKPRAADADQRKFTKAPWTPEPSESSSRPKKSFGAKGGGGKFSGRPQFGGRAGSKPGGFAKRPLAGDRPARKPRTEE